MRAAFCVEKGKVVVREIPVPTPEAEQVLIRVDSCGICGSDLHCYAGTVPPSPECMGHEISGVVSEIGNQVDKFTPGDRVVVEPILVCHGCQRCRTGQRQLCRQLRLLGTTAPGGMAEYLAVPAYTLFRIPDSLDLKVAALVEPTAIAVHAIRLAGIALGHQVVVMGAGTIGLLCVLVAKAIGATVAVTARYRHQQELAATLGADAILDPGNSTEVGRYSEEMEIDVVIETVGGEAETLTDALNCIRPGGRIVTLGIFTKTISLNPFQLVLKEARMNAAVFYSRSGHRSDFSLAIDLLMRERLLVEKLLTHRVPLAGVAEAFATAADKSAGAVKVLLEGGCEN